MVECLTGMYKALGSTLSTGGKVVQAARFKYNSWGSSEPVYWSAAPHHGPGPQCSLEPTASLHLYSCYPGGTVQDGGSQAWLHWVGDQLSQFAGKEWTLSTQDSQCLTRLVLGKLVPAR